MKLTIQNKGFTLIELIVVMAIIAILVLLAAPRFLGYTKDANVTALHNDVKILEDTADLYHANNNSWPVNEDKVVIDNNLFNSIKLGVGGNDISLEDLSYLNDEYLNKDVKNIKNNISDYVILNKSGHSNEGKIFYAKEFIENSKDERFIEMTSYDELLMNYIKQRHGEMKELPSGIKDEIITNKDGTIKYIKRVSDWIELDNNEVWHIANSFSDSHQVYIGKEFLPNTVPGKDTEFFGYRYDGVDAAVFKIIDTGARLGMQLELPITETGWGPKKRPTQSEIRAYFYGWQMANADGSVPYTSGTKHWKRIIDGKGLTDKLPTSSYEGYTPYKIIYQYYEPEIYVIDLNKS